MMKVSSDRSVSRLDQEEIISALQTDGYATIPGYMPTAECDRIRAVMDNFIATDTEHVHGSEETDDRIFAAEYIDDGIARYKKLEEIENIGTSFVGVKQNALFTLANRIVHRPGIKIRSGGRWHRDRKDRQFKALLYLSDVTKDNGPFSVLPQSAIPSKAFEREIDEALFAYGEQRWGDDEINPFLSLVGDRLEILTGTAGMLVIFDSSTIHSGQPIKAGARYALTNYYYCRSEVNIEKFRKKWHMAAGPIDFNAPVLEKL